MTILKPQSGVPLLLGKQGEYNVTAVDFSDFLRSYAQEFGQGTLTVTHRRYEDDGPYAVPLADGIWTVRETDLEYAGNGICELVYTFPNGTKKSTKWQTQVLTGLGQTIDPPEPWQAYIDRVLEAVASVENVVAGETARRAAETARVSAESTRAARETARQQSENVRISAESNRNAAERNRVSQEAARVNAESARATAETARAKAETSRAATFSAVTAQATEAAATARQMAIAAEEAAETADAAAQTATQVVSRVDEAVTAAEAASASAAQAVSSAQTAVTNANAAVQRVESYADDMTAVKRDTAQAKSEAQAAKSEAQTAKSEAQSAAAAAAAAVKTVNNTAPDSTGNVTVNVDTRKIESDIADLQTDVSTLTDETGELKSALEGKLDTPEDAPTVGKVLRIKSVNEDGSFVCEWADGGTGGVSDVLINGTSILSDGVANIPSASQNVLGVVQIPWRCGLDIHNTGEITVSNLLVNERLGIPARTKRGVNWYGCITTTNFDYAVKRALIDPGETSDVVDAKPLIYTPEEQRAAQEKLGILSVEGVTY